MQTTFRIIATLVKVLLTNRSSVNNQQNTVRCRYLAAATDLQEQFGQLQSTKEMNNKKKGKKEENYWTNYATTCAT